MGGSQRNPDILTATELARELGVGRTTVYTWAKTGVIPSLRLGRVVRFSRTQVLQAVQRRTTDGLAPAER